MSLMENETKPNYKVKLASWITFLDTMLTKTERDGYDGTCNCYACQDIRKRYEIWKINSGEIKGQIL